MTYHCDLRRRLYVVAIVIVSGLLLACTVLPGGNRDIDPAPVAGEAPARSSKDSIRMQAPPSVGHVSAGPLRLSMEDAIFLTLENNRSLAVERINPSLQQTVESQERAVFDPSVGAELSGQRIDSPVAFLPVAGSQINTASEVSSALSINKFFPTGTTVVLDAANDTNDSDLNSNSESDTRLGLSVTQSLLRGYGSGVNLARLRQAELDTVISQYELRGFSQALLARVENIFWDYALAGRRIEIVEESLKVVNQQLSETEEMIRVGVLAEAELAAVQAEVALQQQGLINARSDLATVRLQLLRLINRPGERGWEREVSLVYQPILPEVSLEPVEEHLRLARKLRPDLNQARLAISRGELEIVRTRNGLLPRMDLFVNLGKSGYADSFGGSLSDLGGDAYDVQAGIQFQYPIYNRGARAQYRGSMLQQEQNRKALQNLIQLAELDVLSAHIEIGRTREQITASTATRKFQEEKLRIETEKFRVGRSTNFLVTQAQRDLLIARIDEVQSIVDYLKSLTDFYLLEGSLLERRGIIAPGRETTSTVLEDAHPPDLSSEPQIDSTP